MAARWRVVVVAALVTTPAAAEPSCPVLDLDFQVALPSDPANGFLPQVVGWLEDTQGNFVDTVYITKQTGTFGLGNRPGRFDFNSSPFWPYGRRIQTFPVWSTKQPLRWPELVFQDGNDDGLSHSQGDSSREFHYCRPLRESEFDALSCPSSMAFTDKGMAAGTTSRYPPREDVDLTAGIDHPSAEMFAMMNPFDFVSQATPAAGVRAQISWAIPPAVPPGDYVLFFEVSKEFDFNATYNPDSYPSPTNIAFGDYGGAYRGQPSIVYRLPFTFTTGDTTATTLDYVGYGDPDGLDGNLRAPDGTISTLPGSGAGRLAVLSDNGTPYRVRVRSRSEIDAVPPEPPAAAEVAELTANRVAIRFTAPGDDGLSGKVQSYEIRYRVNESITADNFAAAHLVAATVEPENPGGEQTFALEGLLPETRYSIGIRAFDNCRNASTLTIVELTTPERPLGEVDACFIATAAYGSVMADDVVQLRRMRDSLLAKSVLGELAIEAYYTFSPAIGNVVGESELLRTTARGTIEPFVTWFRNFRF